MQIGFINQYSKPVIPSVLRLVKSCERWSLPIVFTKFVNKESSPFESLLGWTALRHRPEIDLHDAFVDRTDTLIEKNSYTAFTDEFERILESQACRTLLISGISTESCILKTAIDAFEKEYRPVVISDACASDQGTDVHKHALDILRVLIGKNQIMSFKELAQHLDL